jgi:DNA-directed RNA polymerase specialized sigma24 family protein
VTGPEPDLDEDPGLTPPRWLTWEHLEEVIVGDLNPQYLCWMIGHATDDAIARYSEGRGRRHAERHFSRQDVEQHLLAELVARARKWGPAGPEEAEHVPTFVMRTLHNAATDFCRDQRRQTGQGLHDRYRRMLDGWAEARRGVPTRKMMRHWLPAALQGGRPRPLHGDTVLAQLTRLWALDPAKLQEKIHALPAEDRELLVDRYVNGASNEQLGARYGISADAARKRAEAVLDKLREGLALHPRKPATVAERTREDQVPHQAGKRPFNGSEWDEVEHLAYLEWQRNEPDLPGGWQRPVDAAA